MRRFLLLFIALFVTFGIFINDVDAKRFGGGRSFGVQRPSNTFTRTSSAPLTNNASSTRNRWLGPLAGLAAGGLLAYLMMGHGMGSGIFSWLMIFGIGFMLWNLFRSRLQPTMQAQSANRFNSQQNMNYGLHEQQPNVVNFPSGFDQPEFLRSAKSQFIRLQAAYDNKNSNDIREFTTPEVFAEIQLQFQERGDVNNFTEVVSLQAELLDVATEFQATVATVRFSGMIREEQNAAANSFEEVWHFKKNSTQHNWLVAGVQQ